VNKFNYLTKAVVLAAAVFLGHPDTALAQLSFTPNPVQFTISAPGGAAGPTSVAVSSNTQINSLGVSSINTTAGGNWLCAIPSGTNTVNVYIGSGNCSVPATTTQLAANQNYTGTITLLGNGGTLSGTLNVNLGVGTSGGGGNNVVATPSSVTFNATPGGFVNPQTVQVTVNGSPQNITSFSFTPTSGVAFLNTAFNGSTATLSVNNTNLGNGTYTGTETLSTIFGSVNIPVTLTIGSGGGGVVASPSSVTFFAIPGGQVNSQNVSVTVNGAATSINGFSFTATSGGVAFISTVINGSTATLSVNTTNLANGVYTGTETLNTVFGSVSVPVTLNITSSGSNLVATPNPLNFTIPLGGGTPPAQNVTITFNGAPVNILSVSATTSGRNWLVPTVSGTPGVVSVIADAALVVPGTQSGTVTVNTAQGTTTFQVNVVVGGTPTLQVSPAALNFAYQVGASFPVSQNVSITSSGSPINYSVSSFTNSGGTQWLIVSPQGLQQTTPGTLTVSVQPGGLQPGNTYTGNIQITTFGGSSNSFVNIPVSLLVSNNPILTVSPAGLTFTAQQGSTPAAQILTLQSSSSPLNFNVSGTVTTPIGFNWLQVPTQFGVTPGTVPVNVVTSGLSPGTYTGAVNISSPNVGNPTISVPVTLVITAGSVLQLSPASLSFAYQIGQGQPQSQTVTVGSASGQVGYTVVPSQNSSGTNWLSVSTTTGVAPGSFAVGVNIAGLAPGAYTGTITVTPTNGAAQTIPVTFVVSQTALLVATPNSISFTAQPATGSTPATVSPSFQNLAVTSTDGTQITFSVGVTYSTGAAGWLFVNTSTGVTPSNLSITANPSNLGIGTYTATITLTATSPASVANSPQVINVTMTVSPNVSLAASPSSLAFTQSVNGAAPAPQTFTVTGAGQIPFTAFATTSQGGAWLSVNPTSGTTPATLTVSIVNSFLQPGTYQGQIAISTAGSANPVNVPVTLTVGSSTGGLANAGSIAHLASAGLWKTIITLFNTGTVASQARLNFYDDNGNPLALPLSFPQFSPIAQAPVTTLDRTLAAGATLIIESTGPDNQVTQQGWAQLLSSGNINGFSVFRQTVPSGQHEAVVPIETRNAGSYLLAFDNTAGFVTGVALALAGTGGNVGVTIRDDNGVLLQSNTVPLPSQGHTAFDITTRFPVTAQRRGTIEFQTTPFSGSISVLGIRFNPAGTFSTVPPAAK
jgi:hypothetical protein